MIFFENLHAKKNENWRVTKPARAHLKSVKL